MIQKICPSCRLDSYSAYNDPNWKCPYCGRLIPKVEIRKGNITVLSKERKLRVVR